MAHGSEIVYLIRLNLLNDADEVGRIGQIAIVEEETAIGRVWILIDMIYAIRVEERGTPFKAMDDIPLLKEKLSEIGTILTCYASDKSYFSAHRT